MSFHVRLYLSVLASASSTLPKAPRPSSRLKLNDDSFVNGVFCLPLPPLAINLSSSSIFFWVDVKVSLGPYSIETSFRHQDTFSLTEDLPVLGLMLLLRLVASVGEVGHEAVVSPLISNVSNSKSGSLEPMTNCSPVSCVGVWKESKM